jgi:hypothetical protein
VAFEDGAQEGDIGLEDDDDAAAGDAAEDGADVVAQAKAAEDEDGVVAKVDALGPAMGLVDGGAGAGEAAWGVGVGWIIPGGGEAAVGREVEIPEAQIDALMAVSGCGPAFVFEFCAALREAGMQAGLDRATAQLLATETILGAGKLLVHTGAEPEDLRNQVTSPHGTTFAGLKRMEARDFRGMMVETVQAAKARSEELSRDA